MIDTLQLYNELKETLDSSAAEKIAETIGLVYDELRTVVTKSEFNGLERQTEFQDHKLHLSGLEVAQEQSNNRMDRVEAILERLSKAQERADIRMDRIEAAMEQTNIRIDRLVEAQAKTEAALEQLSKAQAKTEATVEQTNIRMDKLVEAQARTEAAMEQTNIRIDRLVEAQAKTEATVEQLVEAQHKTEATVEQTNIRMDKLVEAQARTEVILEQTTIRMDRVESAVDRLAEAQARTEAALEQTNIRIDRQNKQLGGLSDAIGGDIEDIAYIVLHKVLNREFGWQVGELKRMWQTWGEQSEEIDIMGQAVDPTRPEETIWIVGEAKHNITEKGVRKFIRQLERAKLYLDGEIFPVCFCYRARPEVQKMIVDANIRLVYSYGELV